MVFERSVRLVRLFRQRSSAQIARRAVLENDAPCDERFCQRRIVHHRDSMPNSFSTKNLHRVANGFRTANLARMTHDSEALLARIIEGRTKAGCRSREII